ncbi:class A sortase [Bacillus sp. HSf4]|uniref:class A sortase n=1 Tax=Bacillus sp. HSf4 TaxID=3035514 RepID=UPI00240A8D17|nr:class A sortase [Bacillus sp. HSf4]WFA03818.1 class A sortase [Bacillus sp. HSf4]
MIEKENNKEKLKDYLFISFFICLILIGMLLVLSPWLKNVMIKEATVKYSLDKFTAEEVANNQESAEEVPWDSAIEAPNFTTVLTSISKVNQKDVLGAISIDDVDILLPILNGTNTQNLLVGATTVNEGQIMGEGNYVLAGHHMRNHTLLFGPLLEVEVGTFIQITDKANIYTYQVVDKKIVKETNLSIVGKTTVPTVTLITCDVAGINTNKRLVIRGELMNTSSYSADNEYVNMYKLQEEKEGRQSYSIISWSILLIGLVILFVYGMYIYKGRKI